MVAIALVASGAQATPAPAAGADPLDVVAAALRHRPDAAWEPSSAAQAERVPRVEVDSVGVVAGPDVRRLELEAPARDLVGDPAGTTLYVLPSDRSEVLVVDANTAAVTGTIALPNEPVAGSLSIDGQTLYVLTIANAVSEVDLATGQVTRTVDVSAEAEGTPGDVVEITPGVVAVASRYLVVYETPLLFPEVRRVADDTEVRAFDLVMDRERDRLFVFTDINAPVLRIDTADPDLPVAASSGDLGFAARGALSGDGSRLRTAGGQDLDPLTLAVIEDVAYGEPYTLPGRDIGAIRNPLVTPVAGEPVIERFTGAKRTEAWPMDGCKRQDTDYAAGPTPLADHSMIAIRLGSIVCISDVPTTQAHVSVDVERRPREQDTADVCLDLLTLPLDESEPVHARVVGPVDFNGTVSAWVRGTRESLGARVWDCGPGTTDYAWLATDVVDRNGHTRQQSWIATDATAFRLAPRQSLDRPVQLQPATVVVGVVRNAATGEALEGVEVSAIDPSGASTPRFGLSNKDGVHGFAGVPIDAGVTFRFHDPEGRVADEWFLDRATRTTADTLTFTYQDEFIVGLDAAMGKVGSERFAGQDRYQTAARFSQALIPPLAPVAYLTTGTNFPDALAGAPAAALDGASIVLTTPDALHPDAAAELQRLDPGEIVVLGGPNAVSEAVVVAARPFARSGTVRRAAGNDRFETAAAIVRGSFPSTSSLVFIATGEAFPDALAAGAVAGAVGAPLLLVRRGELPAATAAELQRLQPSTVVVAGGPTAVADGVLGAIANLSGADVVRVAGENRFETAAMLAEVYDPGVPAVFLATGRNYPDALVAGPGAAITPGPLLLVDPDALPPATAEALDRLDPLQVIVMGGTSIVSEAVEDQARRYVVR